MNARGEEFLYYLLWASEKLCRPTYRNIEESFEAWAYRNGLSKQLARLEQRGLLERKRGKAARRVYRLSEKGRLHALGGRDPSILWAAPWDGRWRMLLYDLPSQEQAARKRLRLRLRAEGFGMLQQSVWVSPRSLSPELARLSHRGDDVSSLISVDTVPAAGEPAERIVQAAWDFAEIGRRYADHLRILKTAPRRALTQTADAKALQIWATKERLSWRRIAEADPFLPRELLPRKYPGERVWAYRCEVLARVHRLVERASL